MTSPNPTFDTQHFKQALSRFPTDVSVITTHQLGDANPAEWGHQFAGLQIDVPTLLDWRHPIDGW